jgi:hypothetical protein
MSLTVPDISNGVWRFTLPGGIVIGESPYLIDAPGPQVFGAPDLRRVTRPRPGDHGVLFVGPDLLGSVKVVIPVVVLGMNELDAMTQLQALAGACSPIKRGDAVLTMQGPRGTWQINGRFDPLDAPSLLAVDAGIVNAIVTFEASDPRLRDATANQLVLQAGVLPHDAGYGYAHGYPIGYDPGTGAPGARGVVTNNGDIDATALITITASGGNLVNPAVTLPDSGDVLGFNINLAPGQYLITDTETGAVTLGSSPNDPNAVNRTNALNYPNNADMLRFGPGNTNVALTAQSGQGTATIQWQHTYIF